MELLSEAEAKHMYLGLRSELISSILVVAETQVKASWRDDFSKVIKTGKSTCRIVERDMAGSIAGLPV